MSGDVPQQLFDEAAERLEAFYLKLLSWTDVVAWADTWILKLSQSPDELIEVSLSQSRPSDGIDALAILSRRSNEETVLPFLKAHWRERYSKGQIDTLALTEQIWNLRGVYVPFDSDEYLQICGLEHLLEEAQGGYQITDEQRQESLELLGKELRKWLDS